MSRTLSIEVIYALPDAATIRVYALEPPATVADALCRAAADPAFPRFDPQTAVAGIYGRIVGRDAPLAAGDRLEIYRPLVCDPKSARRARARTAPGRSKR
jgi:putative ubiquitin-RnfH superfamily antitoxin RatB of RatAB toxin-antitoxin module